MEEQEVGDPSSAKTTSQRTNAGGASGTLEFRTFKCIHPLCIYSTNHRSNLRRHVITMHASNKSFKKCCDRYFYSKQHYQQHLQTEHVNGYGCELCQIFFKRRSILSRHMDGIHGTHPHAHQCSLCTYSTSHKYNLNRHYRLKHKKVATDQRVNANSMIWRPWNRALQGEISSRNRASIRMLESQGDNLEAASSNLAPSDSSTSGYLHKKLRWKVLHK